MSDAVYTFVSYDLPALLAAVLAVVSCALLGNFLVLRRMSLMGDAISHAVLPGLAAAFLLSGSRATMPMLLGAAAAGVVTVALVEVIKRLGRVESGAAMGVVFSVLFALGVLLISHVESLGQVDLDADCVLHGAPENIFWLPPGEWAEFWHWETFRPALDEEGQQVSGVPRQVVTLGVVAIAVALFVGLFFKELRIASFDPALATSLGFPAGAIHFVLMILVAASVVASFEAVGSILVIAMLICPAATARLLTDRLLSQVVVSVAVALVTAVGGYWLGAWADVNIGGMMTVVSGALLMVTIVAAPRHGVLAKQVRSMALGVRIVREDLLAMLYRVEEAAAMERAEGGSAQRGLEAGRSAVPRRQILEGLGGGARARLALRSARRRGEICEADGEGATAYVLTDHGREAARQLVRTHRLWESYLVRELGLRPDHVHRTAMALEHVTDRRMERELTPQHGVPALDPHQRPIP